MENSYFPFRRRVHTLCVLFLSLCVGVRVNISGLYFTPRCPQDTGNYTVMAVNDYGLQMASALIHVVCKSAIFCSLRSAGTMTLAILGFYLLLLRVLSLHTTSWFLTTVLRFYYAFFIIILLLFSLLFLSYFLLCTMCTISVKTNKGARDYKVNFVTEYSLQSTEHSNTK